MSKERSGGSSKNFVIDLKEEVKEKINSIGTGEVAKEDNGTVTGKTVFDYIEKSMKNTPIFYSAGEEANLERTTSSTGFQFQGDRNLSVSSKTNGVLQYNLSSQLNGIESISHGETKISIQENQKVDFGGAKICNVDRGELSEESTDTVNGAQLYETKQEIKMVEERTKYATECIQKNAEKIQEVKNEVGQVGALSAALAALHPMQYDPKQPNQVMAGLGHYRDKQAVTVGVTHYFTENVMMSAGVSIGNESKGRTMANVGFTWKLGKEKEKEPEYQEECNCVLHEKINLLLQQNQKQEARIAALEKQLELLLKKN